MLDYFFLCLLDVCTVNCNISLMLMAVPGCYNYILPKPMIGGWRCLFFQAVCKIQILPGRQVDYCVFLGEDMLLFSNKPWNIYGFWTLNSPVYWKGNSFEPNLRCSGSKRFFFQDVLGKTHAFLQLKPLPRIIFRSILNSIDSMLIYIYMLFIRRI